jgi:hypothetical protein
MRLIFNLFIAIFFTHTFFIGNECIASGESKGGMGDFIAEFARLKGKSLVYSTNPQGMKTAILGFAEASPVDPTILNKQTATAFSAFPTGDVHIIAGCGSLYNHVHNGIMIDPDPNVGANIIAGIGQFLEQLSKEHHGKIKTILDETGRNVIARLLDKVRGGDEVEKKKWWRILSNSLVPGGWVYPADVFFIRGNILPGYGLSPIMCISKTFVPPEDTQAGYIEKLPPDLKAAYPHCYCKGLFKSGIKVLAKVKDKEKKAVVISCAVTEIYYRELLEGKPSQSDIFGMARPSDGRGIKYPEELIGATLVQISTPMFFKAKFILGLDTAHREKELVRVESSSSEASTSSESGLSSSSSVASTSIESASSSSSSTASTSASST